jgi:RsiW-degrading membrane proteinase PrsW (M82 family)
MTQRNRKLVGILMMLTSIVALTGIGTAIYVTLLTGQPPLVLIGFFAVTGLAWIVPAMVIIRWMSRAD